MGSTAVFPSWRDQQAGYVSFLSYLPLNLFLSVPGWTRTHGFFVIMGGFHLFKLPAEAKSVPLPLKDSSPSDFVTPLVHHSREKDTPICPLLMDDLPVEILKTISPTETELKD